MPRTAPLARSRVEGPFRKTLDFSGRFIVDNLPTKPLHINIEFRQDRPDKISGRVYGRPDEYLQLLPLLGKQHCRIESIQPNDPSGPSQKICSSSLYVTRLSEGTHSDAMDLNHVNCCLAEIDLFEIEQTTAFEEDAGAGRFISFFLTGPEFYWNLFAIRNLYSDGRITYFRRKPRKLVFHEMATGIRCWVNKFYLYNKIDNPKTEVSTYLVVLEFHSNKDMPDNEFLSLCKNHVETCTSLMSFISRRGIE